MKRKQSVAITAPSKEAIQENVEGAKDIEEGRG